MSNRKRIRNAPRVAAPGRLINGDAVSEYRLKLPNGRTVTVHAPSEDCAQVLHKMARGEASTDADRAVMRDWLALQHPDYVRYMLATIAIDGAAVTEMQNDTPGFMAGTELPEDTPAANIVGRLMARLQSGDIGLCKHVRHNAPDAGIWFPWKPEKIRCRECAYQLVQQIKGTKEDRRCDNCGWIGAKVAEEIFRLPPIYVCHVIIPVISFFGLCGKCHAQTIAGKAG